MTSSIKRAGEPLPSSSSLMFPAKSFLILDLNNPLRRAAIKFITWRWFERFSLLMIVLNCVALGLADPCDTRCRKPMCATLQIVEDFISAFFAIEMLIKMTAMGVFGKKAYLDESWNRFDCFIVIVGTFEYIFADQEINLSAIRAIRVLRPLRAINRISSLRLLVTLLLDILPMLGNVLIFCFFVFFVFGIIGVQLWAGMLRHRCFFPKSLFAKHEPPPFMPLYYRQPHREYVCSSAIGELQCSSIPMFERHSSMCTDLFGSDPTKIMLCQRWVANYTDCRPEGPNPARGTMNFDNIGFAWIAIFQVISLESWTEVMYMVQDSFSFWVWIFFIALVLIGSYLAVNLCLVVIATQFTETKMRETERLKKERMESSEYSLTSTVSRDGLYTQLLDLIYHYCRVVKRKLFRVRVGEPHLTALVMSVRAEAALPPQCSACRCVLRLQQAAPLPERRQPCPLCGNDPYAAKEAALNKKRHGTKQHYYKGNNAFFRLVDQSRKWLKQILENDIAVAIVAGTIILNALIMALEHHNQPQQLTHFIETMNLIFTAIFVTELVVKMYAFGFDAFIAEAFNMLDTIVIAINVAELFSSSGSSGGGSGFAVLRLFRLVRIVKIIRFLPALQKQLVVMFSVVDHVATFFVLLGFFLFISSLLGMSLFGCKFCEQTSVAGQADNNNNNNNNATNATCRYKVMTIIEAEQQQMSEKQSAKKAAVSSSYQQQEENFYGCSIANFDSPFQAIFTVLQVFTQDDWGSVMQDGMHYTSEWAGVYFVALVTIGNYILFNLLVAILVEGFSSENSKQDDRVCANEAIALLRRNTNRELLHQLASETVDIDEEASDKKLNNVDADPDEVLVSSNQQRGHFCQRMLANLRQCWLAELSDRSLFIFSKEAFPRKQIRCIFASEVYDQIFLAVILGSCSLIIIERPSIDKDSLERKVLNISNHVFNSIFLIEATLKIIAYGFCLGRNTYIRSKWNVLDLFLISIAVIDVALEFQPDIDPSNRKVLQTLRILRLLRALRPLRIISRSPGLQIVLQTLMISIKPIGNIILICCFFFLIFAILGVQLFSGCYARCLVPRAASSSNTTSLTGGSVPESFSEWAMEALSNVQTRNDCLAMGLEWETDSYNFNSLPDALMALFVFATLDGWTDITRNGVDCVGADRQPVRDYNMWAYVYFISFLLIVCFFTLNMFVGVVVNNFQSVQRQVRAQFESKRQKESLVNAMLSGVAKQFPSLKEKRQHRPSNEVVDKRTVAHYSPWRRSLYRLVTHKYFEYAVLSATVVNVVMMTIEFYMMPRWLQQTIAYASFVFLALLAMEVFLKTVAFGLKTYVSDRWNQIDVFIVFLSIVGVILEELPKDAVPVNPAIVTFPRVFRIVRILKLLKSASGVRKLLETLSEAIPQVVNLSLLFLLLFFIYASLGVELYGRFDCNFEVCEGLSRHANFQNFGMALLTLFRIFTGDNWNGILKDVLWMSNDPQECSQSSDDHPNNNHGGIACGIIHTISPAYFVSFVLLAQFVLINVVVAVLMSQLEDAHKKAVDDEQSSLSPNENRTSNAAMRQRVLAADEESAILGRNMSMMGSYCSDAGYGIQMHTIINPDAIMIAEQENGDKLSSSVVMTPTEVEETFLLSPPSELMEAVSVASCDFVLHRQDFCDAEYLVMKLRNLTIDSDSAVVSDITMSPLTSPGGSPVRVTYRGNRGDNNGGDQTVTFHSSFERRQPPSAFLRSPRSSLDLLDDLRLSSRNYYYNSYSYSDKFAGYNNNNNNSSNSNNNINGNYNYGSTNRVTSSNNSNNNNNNNNNNTTSFTAVDIRRAKFAGKLPVVPESPSSTKDEHYC